MSYWKIAWRNIEQRALASSLTALSMALGVAAMIVVIVIHSVAVRQFTQDAQGYHLIVGGKGGSLQLVLSTVFHVGQPLYPIPYTYYQQFVDGEFSSVTEAAIPIALGDTYEAPNGTLFRVVGTTPDLFDKIQYGMAPDPWWWTVRQWWPIGWLWPTTDRAASPLSYEFQPGGRNFQFENFFEAVVGSVVAAQAGLKVGDTIEPTHGISGEGELHDEFTVVGILKPTGTANDRAVFVNLEGFYLLDGHALAPPDDVEPHPAHELYLSGEIEHEPLPIAQREVTSILVKCSSPLGPMVLDTAINKSEDRIAQAVSPAREVTMLLDRIVGPVRLILLVLTVLIIIVAGIGILVSIYNSMSERSHDIAVMRALGASRGAVMMIVLVESILLSLGGGLVGVLLAHGLIGLAGPYVVAKTGIALDMFQFHWQELVLIPGLVVLASLVGFLPAVAAYRTDVAKSLGGGR